MNTKRLVAPLFVIGIILILTGTLLFVSAQDSDPSSTQFTIIRGYIVAGLIPAGAQENEVTNSLKEIYLPGVTVTLKDSADQIITSEITDLSGRFTLKAQGTDAYQICAEAQGFSTTCFDQFYKLDLPTLYSGTLRIWPARPEDDDRGATSIFGRVLLRDGKRPRFLNSLAGANTYTLVDYKDSTGDTYSAYLNNFGEYVIPQVSVQNQFTLTAAIDQIQYQQVVEPETGLRPGFAFQFDLQIENTSPKLAPIVPLNTSGARVEFARPGETVVLNARAEDQDGDTLTYQWLVYDGNGTLNITDQPTVEWKLPSLNGRYAVTAIVSDDMGGYAESYFSFRVSTGGVRFSGTIIDGTGAYVPLANIEINGRNHRANATGWFQVEVPPADRYVMNIRKPGYALTSQIYPNGITGNTWTLRKGQQFSVDPTLPIQLQQQRTPADCPGSRSQHLPWEDGYLLPGLIQMQDGKGNAVSITEFGTTNRREFTEVLTLLAEVDYQIGQLGASFVKDDIQFRPRTEIFCGPGIAIEIPPNSLVDQNGNPPPGNVDITLATVDLGSPEQMPGDYSSLDTSGNPTMMESFGAGSVEIRAGNSRYNLKPGTTATVTIPVDPGQILSGVSLPATIPLLFYNERQGVWVEEGVLTLSGSGFSSVYTGIVTHFSAINADLQFTNPSCIAVRSGPGLPTQYMLEVIMPPDTPGAAYKRKTEPIDSSASSEHVIYYVSNNVNIVLIPIVPGIRPDGSTGDVPAGVFVVNSGGPQVSAVSPPLAPYYNQDAAGNPLGPCLTRVDLANLAIPSAPNPGQFLQGLDLQATNLTELATSNAGLAAQIEAASDNYYDIIDPRDLRLDLLDFKARNKFGSTITAPETAQGVLEVSATYANSGDLGFGRNMNCRRNLASDGQFDIACYVTNYGDHLTPDAQDAADAATQNASAEVATVAMEYSRVENPLGDPIEFPDNQRTVKFYVFAKAEASLSNIGLGNGRVTSANLDGFGNRPVPQLCIVCHGGVYANEPVDPLNPTGPQRPAFALRSDVFMNSRFIPFDLHFFTSPPAPNTVAAQEPAFRTLNLEIVKFAPGGMPASDPVIELINAFYPGSPPAATQVPGAVVPGWDATNPNSPNHVYYRDVFARACRSCHINAPFNNITMQTSAQFRAADVISKVQSRVCIQHVMPHAQRTHDLFWTSLGPNMAAVTQIFGQPITGWDPNSPPPPAPPTQCGLSYTAGGNSSVNYFTTNVQPIFTTRCVGCHGTASTFNANLSLTAGNAYSNTVGVASSQLPTMVRITAGNSANSYLYRKAEGTHGSLPSCPTINGQPCGASMPLGGAALNTFDTDVDGTNDLEELRFWIDNLGAAAP